MSSSGCGNEEGREVILIDSVIPIGESYADTRLNMCSICGRLPVGYQAQFVTRSRARDLMVTTMVWAFVGKTDYGCVGFKGRDID